MKRSELHQIVGTLVCANRKDLVEKIISVIKGPKEAQKIYLKIRNKEKDKGKAARIAWFVYRNKHPEWVPKYKRKTKATGSFWNWEDVGNGKYISNKNINDLGLESPVIFPMNKEIIILRKLYELMSPNSIPIQKINFLIHNNKIILIFSKSIKVDMIDKALKLIGPIIEKVTKKSVVSSVIKNQKSFKEFNTFENNIQPGDSYTIRNVKGEDGKIYDLKLIFKGLSSSWTNNNWKVVQIHKGKKTASTTMKEKDLYKFLELNNLSDK